MKKCIVCNLELTGKQTKFCSNKCKHKTQNNKHQNYIAQQKRGRDRKLELIKMFGSKCIVCGYNKNYSALCFHHQEPDKKDFQLDLRKLSNSKWEKILEEVNKCILLCHNCHSELHHPDAVFT